MTKNIIPLLFVLYLLNACNTAQNEDDIEKNTDTLLIRKIEKELTNDSMSTSKLEEDIPVLGNKTAMQQDDEEIVFSFKTEKGKIMKVLLHKQKKYMVYRFGSENNIELQFPEELSNTFEQFTYSYYMRGGGAMNAGIDLNYLSFSGDTHKFIIFDESSAGESDSEEESQDIGIRIINLSTKKEIVIKGLTPTIKGSLVDFRFNELIKVKEAEM